MACEAERRRVEDLTDILAADAATRQGTYNFSQLAAAAAWWRVYGISARSPLQIAADLEEAKLALLSCEAENMARSLLPEWLGGAVDSLKALMK